MNLAAMVLRAVCAARAGDALLGVHIGAPEPLPDHSMFIPACKGIHQLLDGYKNDIGKD